MYLRIVLQETGTLNICKRFLLTWIITAFKFVCKPDAFLP